MFASKRRADVVTWSTVTGTHVQRRARSRPPPRRWDFNPRPPGDRPQGPRQFPVAGTIVRPACR